MRIRRTLAFARADDMREFQLKRRYFSKIKQLRDKAQLREVKQRVAQLFYLKKCFTDFQQAVIDSIQQKEKKMMSLKFYALRVQLLVIKLY